MPSRVDAYYAYVGARTTRERNARGDGLNVAGAPTAPNCLTAEQAAALDKIWDGPRNHLSGKCFSYFLLGRLRFCDDVAFRRFAHLVSDGLPLI
jgi:hypothetical protein